MDNQKRLEEIIKSMKEKEKSALNKLTQKIKNGEEIKIYYIS